MTKRATTRLTTAALARALSVTTRQVRRWLDKGCPSARVRSPRGGRPRHAFDLAKVKTWLVSKGIAPGGAPAPAAPDAAAVQQLGYGGMLERSQHAERSAFTAWAEAARDKNPDPVIIAARARTWKELSEQLRKLETSAANIRRNDTDWLPRSQVVDAIERMVDEIRTALLALPVALAPRVARLKPAAARKLLTSEIDKALRILSNPVPPRAGSVQ